MEDILDLARPLEILYCWQALLVALTAAGLVRFFKAIDDIAPTKWRQTYPWMGTLVFPVLTILIAAGLAMIIPLRPDILNDYVDNKIPEESWGLRLTAYGMWGGACGQFASYVYDRVIAIFDAGIPILDRVRDAVKSAAQKTGTPAVIDDDTEDPGSPLER